MPDMQQNAIEINTVVTCIEQRIKAGSNFTGEAPSLSGNVFAPFAATEDGIFRWKQADDPTKTEGDKGGLFEWSQAFPVALEYILADFGASVTWTLYVVTRTGDTIQIATNTGRYLLRIEYERFYLFRGDKLKLVTTGGAAAMMARIGLSLDSGIT